MSETAESGAATLSVVRDLFDALNGSGLRYCHWKSTTTLDRALSGRTDLDLLVEEHDASAFDQLVLRQGFKRFISHPSRQYPGVKDYLGFDPESGRLVHLHVYHRLVLGEHYIKNHVLPLEPALLDGAPLRDGVRIPPPAAELMVLVVRCLLKYRDVDAFKDLLRLGRRGGIPPDAREEVRDLAARVSREELLAVARLHLPSVPGPVFARFVDVLEWNRRDALALLRLRRAVRIGLRDFQRMPACVARSRYLRARLIRAPVIRQLVRGLTRAELRRKSPARGGLTIALVGADGAGKSTIVRELRSWLAWRLNFAVAYLGSAQPSGLTSSLQATSRVARRLAARHGAFRYPADLLTALRYLSEAHDRLSRIARGRHLAQRGTVTVFDRFPLSSLRLNGRSMDGPRIGTLQSDTRHGLLALLRRREEMLYGRVGQPDLTLLLTLPAHEALRRKPSRHPEIVEAKARAVMEAAREAGEDVVAVDASRPLPEVVAAVRSEIWGRL